MSSPPQKPSRSHTKNISVEASTWRRTEDVSANENTAQSSSKKRLNLRFDTPRNANAGMELVPKPTDSPLDPLNWPKWKRELTFGSLLLGTATTSMLKTILVTVNEVVATELNVSYMSATALTGLPFIFGAAAGVGSSVLGQSIGKRGIYLASSIILLLAAVWNMHVFDSYAQFIVSRLFQGIAWGAFDALVLMSVKDMYFVHERASRVTVYNVTNILFTWGTPILGGYVSQNTDGYRNQIMIINIIQAFSVALLIFATPETSFSRPAPSQSNAASNFEPQIVTTISTPSASGFKSYLSTLRLSHSQSTSKFTLAKALLPLRAICTPTVILTFFLTAPLSATAYAIAHSVSLIFSAFPIILFPARLGYLFILPLVFSLILFSFASLASYLHSRPPNHLSASRHLTAAVPGLVIGVAGLFAFGLYTYENITPSTILETGNAFKISSQGQSLSLKVVSALFGLLVSGSVVLTFAGGMHLKSAFSSTTANGTGEETTVVETAHKFLQDMLTGIFTIGMPLWIEGSNGMLAGLKDTVIALGVVCFVVSSSVGAVLWVKGEVVGKLDARVLRRRVERTGGDGMVMPLQRWKSSESFFEP